MQYEVTGNPGKIDFGAEGIASILQNVRTILCTPIFSVPLDRAFGVDLSVLDSPIPAAQAKLTSALYTALRQYEPRVRVLQIEYVQDEESMIDGRIVPRVLMEVIR